VQLRSDTLHTPPPFPSPKCPDWQAPARACHTLPWRTYQQENHVSVEHIILVTDKTQLLYTACSCIYLNIQACGSFTPPPAPSRDQTASLALSSISGHFR
jgi:hypothetical protein